MTLKELLPTHTQPNLAAQREVTARLVTANKAKAAAILQQAYQQLLNSEPSMKKLIKEIK